MTYADRITPSHLKPKFTATVDGVTGPVSAVIDKISHLPIDFDLDAAIGAQLDVDGEWVGRNRHILMPIVRNWFSFGVDLRGFGQGEWYQNVPPEGVVQSLEDEDYRRLLRAKIAANKWDGTAEGALEALHLLFGPDAKVFIHDPQDMTVTFGFSGTLPSPIFLLMFARGHVPLKPGGVGAKYRVTSVSGSPIFGFGANNEFIGGFGAGAWGIDPETLFT